MNKVYQHGEGLFVSIDETGRMRNLRTGLTIHPRVPFKYLGEMPQVGQVWEAKGNGRVKHILGVEGASVHIRIPEGRAGTVPVEVFIKNHTLRPEPNYPFATGGKDALNVKAADRRYELRDYQNAALGKVKQHCMADVEAVAELYMSPMGEVFRACGTSNGRVGLAIGRNSQVTHLVDEDHFREFYKALPLPGQLWAKGSRYVTVDRVEDGRVYYTDGSSGLRRFLNEYAYINPQLATYLNVGGTHYEGVKPSQFGTPDTLVLDFASLPTGAGKTVIMQQFGRMLRPAPTTENTPCPLNTNTLNRLNAGNALDNWMQYRNTLGAKIRYANQRIKELSK